jgi:hypothetical protein
MTQQIQSRDRTWIHVINPNTHIMSLEQSTVYTQASRVRSALEYLPHIEDKREYKLWEYGISEELVNVFLHPFLEVLTLFR